MGTNPLTLSQQGLLQLATSSIGNVGVDVQPVSHCLWLSDGVTDLGGLWHPIAGFLHAPVSVAQSMRC